MSGGYSEWMISKCSVSCGGGVKTFTRTCTNPPPSNGGKNCSELGQAMKNVPCNGQECRKFEFFTLYPGYDEDIETMKKYTVNLRFYDR